MQNDSWVVYLVLCQDATFYCGITNNLEKRIKTHNNGAGAAYTSHRRPVKLIVVSKIMSHSEAAKLEHRVKRKRKEKKIDFLRLF